MSDFSLSEINERISKESIFIDKLRDQISTVVFGQLDLINRLLIGILANGHILIEGVPGLAKRAVLLDPNNFYAPGLIKRTVFLESCFQSP